ncbi:MAG: hypothetical protein K8U03_21240 [Planctomycetia bacterium]|nr:hypothetical protein [Planctomycetia bacterium]
MIFSPILHVELLTIGRRRRYFFLRVAYALGLLIALGCCFLDVMHWVDDSTLPIEVYGRLTQTFFIAFASIQLGCILLITPAMVAGTIASEHERKTIDYLLTTQLTDTEIAVGKFSARLLTIGSLLIVALPIVGMMMMLGGIGPEMVFKTFWYALLVLLGTASFSLWISASTRHSRAAITSTYLALVALLALPCLLGWFISDVLHVRSGVAYDSIVALVAWNPIILLSSTFDPIGSHFDPWATPFYAGIVYGAFSAVCLVAAVRAVRRTYVNGHSQGAGKLGRFAWSRWLPQRRRKLGNSPMLWKELVSQQNTLKLGWIGRTASIVLYLVAYVGLGVMIYETIDLESGNRSPYYYTDFDNSNRWGYQVSFDRTPLHEFSLLAGGIAGALILLLITARAAGSVAAEKEQDSWLTLLSTPLAAKEIVTAKIVGAIYSIRYWYCFLAVTWACCIVRYPPFAYVVPILISVHLLFGWFCAVVGTLFSIRCKNSLRAIGASLVVVGIVGAGLPLLVMAGIETLEPYPQRSEATVGFIIPILFGLLDNLLVHYVVSNGSPDLYEFQERLQTSALQALATYTIVTPALTWYVYASFDRLTGRILPRSGRKVSHAALPVASPVAQTAAPEASR